MWFNRILNLAMSVDLTSQNRLIGFQCRVICFQWCPLPWYTSIQLKGMREHDQMRISACWSIQLPSQPASQCIMYKTNSFITICAAQTLKQRNWGKVWIAWIQQLLANVSWLAVFTCTLGYIMLNQVKFKTLYIAIISAVQ